MTNIPLLSKYDERYTERNDCGVIVFIDTFDIYGKKKGMKR